MFLIFDYLIFFLFGNNFKMSNSTIERLLEPQESYLISNAELGPRPWDFETFQSHKRSRVSLDPLEIGSPK